MKRKSHFLYPRPLKGGPGGWTASRFWGETEHVCFAHTREQWRVCQCEHTGCRMQGTFLSSSSPFKPGDEFWLLDWPTSPQDPSCLHSPKLGLRHIQEDMAFYVGSGIWTQVLTFAQTVLLPNHSSATRKVTNFIFFHRITSINIPNVLFF